MNKVHYNPRKARTQEERSSSILFPERILLKKGKPILIECMEEALRVQVEYDAKTHQQEVGDIYQLLY